VDFVECFSRNVIKQQLTGHKDDIVCLKRFFNKRRMEKDCDDVDENNIMILGMSGFDASI